MSTGEVLAAGYASADGEADTRVSKVVRLGTRETFPEGKPLRGESAAKKRKRPRGHDRMIKSVEMHTVRAHARGTYRHIPNKDRDAP